MTDGRRRGHSTKTRIRGIVNRTGEMIKGSAVIGVLGLPLVMAASESGLVAMLIALGLTLTVIGLFVSWRRKVGQNDLHELLEILQNATKS